METKLDKITTAVILAGGCGLRMNSDKPKQHIEILGETVLHRSARAFNRAALVDKIVVVCRAEDLDGTRRMLSDIEKLSVVTVGGDNRRESARCGFDAVPEGTDFVAVHDAARCLITPEEIDEVIAEAHKYGAASCCTEVVDTVKLEDDGFIKETLAREHLRLAGTPQVFSFELYKNALEKFGKDVDITDDNMMLERLGVKIRCVNTSSQNIKITTREDLLLAEFILKRRGENV